MPLHCVASSCASAPLACYYQGRSDGGGYIGIYTPQNQSTLKKNFMCVFFSRDPFKINTPPPNQIPGYAPGYYNSNTGLAPLLWTHKYRPTL